MPQLDTVYIFLMYLWTWSTLTMITQKIMTFTMIVKPKKQPLMKKQPTTPPLLWT
uniref:ATP synthase F0 subunit 8 n=1 Tax=Azemiops feae TaxID=8773 RepID=A0A1B0PJ81_AZEFE|nr:ATP synthase F0 subunit 8 [Azemiops feae]AIM52668.1 ATP synthase F0 subunit 8 [Azemiops feae]